MTGLVIIMQTSTFLLISATAMTLGEGNRKSSSTFPQTKYLRLSTNDFNVRNKIRCSGRHGNELNAQSRDLMNNIHLGAAYFWKKNEYVHLNFKFLNIETV